MAEFINPIAMLGDQMTKFTTEIGFRACKNPDEVGAAAVDYLRVAGTWCLATCLPAWPKRWRCANCRRQHRPVLHRQAANGAFLLHAAVPRSPNADAHRPRRQQGADGHDATLA